jgi:gluconolactonase
VAPPSTVSNPPRDFSAQGAPTTYFTDPDVLTIDPSFDGLRQPNAAIQRLWTGALWSEGPAWNSVGRYLVWSDIPNNRQMRWLEDDGHVSVLRSPSNNSNGNTFDFQGRQLSCEHRPARGALRARRLITIIAATHNGKRLNFQRRGAHPDGSSVRIDPLRRPRCEGTADAAGVTGQQVGALNPRLARPEFALQARAADGLLPSRTRTAPSPRC